MGAAAAPPGTRPARSWTGGLCCSPQDRRDLTCKEIHADMHGPRVSSPLLRWWLSSGPGPAARPGAAGVSRARMGPRRQAELLGGSSATKVLGGLGACPTCTRFFPPCVGEDPRGRLALVSPRLLLTRGSGERSGVPFPPISERHRLPFEEVSPVSVCRQRARIYCLSSADGSAPRHVDDPPPLWASAVALQFASALVSPSCFRLIVRLPFSPPAEA